VAVSRLTEDCEIGLELKFANKRRVSIRNDVAKLKSFIRDEGGRRGYILVVGDSKFVEQLKEDYSANVVGRITSLFSNGRRFSSVLFEVGLR